MPVLRSQRSKPSKRKDDEKKEMPPPLASSPPKTRATRSKKVSKIADVDTFEAPKSPTPSTSSTRSLRTRKTRTKPVEEIDLVSPPPIRQTRTTRKKTTASKASKSSVVKTKEKEEKSSEDAEEPVVTVKPAANQPEETKPAKKGKGRLRKRPIESTSEDITEEESDMEPKHKKLTVRQLHKHYVAPLKTVMDAAAASEVFPQLISRIMNRKTMEEQDKNFEQLLKSTVTEMPPPAGPVPKAKGKGRQKRARSPEKTPVKTKVPESFDFAMGGAEDHVPAKKKMIMDQPTPESERAPEEDMFEQSILDPDANANVMAPVSTDTTPNSYESSKKAAVVEVHSKEKVSTETCSQVPEKTTTVVPEKKSVVLDETYVFETPKDDKKEKGPILNTTFTPELFVDSPKARMVEADKTVIISKPTCKESKTSKDALDASVLAPASPEPDNDNDAPNSANGIVSSLVNFFDKNKKEVEVGSKKSKATSSICKTDNAEVSEIDKITSVSVKEVSSVDQVIADNNVLNSTYCVPSTKNTNSNNSSSMMNVTVCVKKATIPDNDNGIVKKEDAIKPIVPPASLAQQTNSSRFMHDSPASRTFVKEPPSLAVVMEEDDDNREKDSSQSTITSEKAKPLANIKVVSKDKEPHSKKGVSSSSSSSSCSSLKSATSQPNLLSNSKKLPSSAVKNGTNYGSAGKLHEIQKPKPLDEAEKRRQELLQQKVENSKKKREEWTKKTEKIKLEEEKRLKDKQKVPQPISSSGILKKPVPLALGKTEASGGLGFPKPKFNFGPSTSKVPNGTSSHLPPLSKNPFHKPLVTPNDVEMDESFKSATATSFLDQTTEGHLSSYDITMYEDLDEDNKHRENKTVPNWASDKEALKVALFSMVLLPDYDHKFPGGFPKPDKSYKLFPGKTGHH